MNRYLTNWRKLATDEVGGGAELPDEPIPADLAAAIGADAEAEDAPPEDDEIPDDDSDELEDDEPAAEAPEDEADPGDEDDSDLTAEDEPELSPADKAKLARWMAFEAQEAERLAAENPEPESVQVNPRDAVWEQVAAQYEDDDEYAHTLIKAQRESENLILGAVTQLYQMVQGVQGMVAPSVTPQLAQKVVDSFSQDIPEEWLPEIRAALETEHPDMLQWRLDPANREKVLSDCHTFIGAQTAQRAKSPAKTAPPKGVALSGAPTAGKAPSSKGYTKEQEAEWADAMRTFHKNTPKEQLAEAKANYFRPLHA